MKAFVRVAMVAMFAAFALAPAAGLHAQASGDVVKQRQDLMKSFYPKYMSVFVKIVQGKSTDISNVPALAAQMAAAVKTIPALFPTGTSHDQRPDSRAKPEIWTQQAQFQGNVNTLADQAQKLADVAKGGNLDAVKAQIAALGKACAACHGGPAKSGGPFRLPSAS